jgi:hypothetical protein
MRQGPFSKKTVLTFLNYKRHLSLLVLPFPYWSFLSTQHLEYAAKVASKLEGEMPMLFAMSAPEA